MSCECDVTIASLTATLKMKNDQCEALILERDRYKAALEKIANTELLPGDKIIRVMQFQNVAYDALHGTEIQKPIILPDGTIPPDPKGVSFDGSGGSWRVDGSGIKDKTNE